MGTKFAGSVVRTESLTSERDYSLTIQEGNGELLRVRMLKGAIEHAPRRGEYVEVTGEFRNSDVFGEMFFVDVAALRLPPDSRAISALFAFHPMFSFIDRVQRLSIEKSFHESLLAALGQGDVIAVCNCGLSPEVAIDLCNVWQTYAEELRLIESARGLKVLPRTLKTLVNCLPEAAASVHANPYSLSAMVRWEDIESRAKGMGFAPNDPRRLAGATTAVFFSNGERQHWVFNKADFFLRVAELFGSPEFTDEAFRLAMLKELLHVDDGGQVQDRASHLLSSAAQRRFSDSDGVRHFRNGTRSRLNAAKVLGHAEPKAVHLFPNQRLATASGCGATATFAELLQQSPERPPHKWDSVVVHGFDLLDGCSLNRLLYCIDKTRFTLVSAEEAPRQPWWPDRGKSKDPRIPLSATRSHGDINEADKAVETDLIEEALFLYRSNAENSSVLVLCEDISTANHLNSILHEETFEYRKYENLDSREIALWAEQTATIDEPVIWRRNALDHGCIKGTAGRLQSIGTNQLDSNHRDHSGFTVELDERQQVSVPWSERESICLGYAASIGQPLLQSWDCVIALVTDSAHRDHIVSCARDLCLDTLHVVCGPDDGSRIDAKKELNAKSQNSGGPEKGGKSSIVS